MLPNTSAACPGCPQLHPRPVVHPSASPGPALCPPGCGMKNTWEQHHGPGGRGVHTGQPDGFRGILWGVSAETSWQLQMRNGHLPCRAGPAPCQTAYAMTCTCFLLQGQLNLTFLAAIGSHEPGCGRFWLMSLPPGAASAPGPTPAAAAVGEHAAALALGLDPAMPALEGPTPPASGPLCPSSAAGCIFGAASRN